ncbi:hypothetical protein ABEB36_005425 [Hypothenemus hampei]|uniref:RING-type domain-containing protein n=1 Tax=Hypothenemus hampei TaxID=57062 RepID=A0ABD1EZ94_HYPHA
MLNFMNPKLLPKITRKPMCTENYEPENLISTNYQEKIRGFIAYPSIKPPVEIEFELICNVNISYIFLKTTVGSHKCSGIEIFVKNNVSTCYFSVGKAVNYDAESLIFCNSKQYSQAKPPDNPQLGNFQLFFFKNGTVKSYSNACKVKILIFKTERSVPCLASIEIWGRPSKNCSQKTIDTINRLVQSDSKQLQIPGNSNSNETDNFTIPEEFKDDLTYELMTIPFTLPCGKTIDQTTLEKYHENEKSFGRKPGDPFTGIKFTDRLKPILNVGLKSRIDMFLLKNSDRSETFNLKRTLRTKVQTDKRPKISEHFSGNSDLDVLIEKAKSYPGFTAFTCVNSSKNICENCKHTFEYVYELPCKHYFCRKCLLDICKDLCTKCTRRFVNSEVRKVHF